MHIRFFVISLFLLTLWNACTKSDKEHQNVIAEMTGREIVFPEVLNYQIGDKMIDFNPSEADYKIIVYIDSTGCTIKIPCRKMSGMNSARFLADIFSFGRIFRAKFLAANRRERILRAFSPLSFPGEQILSARSFAQSRGNDIFGKTALFHSPFFSFLANFIEKSEFSQVFSKKIKKIAKIR